MMMVDCYCCSSSWSMCVVVIVVVVVVGGNGLVGKIYNKKDGNDGVLIRVLFRVQCDWICSKSFNNKNIKEDLFSIHSPL